MTLNRRSLLAFIGAAPLVSPKALNELINNTERAAYDAPTAPDISNLSATSPYSDKERVERSILEDVLRAIYRKHHGTQTDTAATYNKKSWSRVFKQHVECQEWIERERQVKFIEHLLYGENNQSTISKAVSFLTNKEQ
jgi:hypothetical protein